MDIKLILIVLPALLFWVIGTIVAIMALLGS